MMCNFAGSESGVKLPEEKKHNIFKVFFIGVFFGLILKIYRKWNG